MNPPPITSPVLDLPGSQRSRATPLVTIRAVVGDRPRQIRLKLEGENPSGSVKFRTAAHLLRGLLRDGALESGQTVVESTSGNLGVALAYLAYIGDWHFRAVVDPKSPPYYLNRMTRLGAEIDMVSEPDPHGNFLGARLQRVSELLESNGRYVWPNQYENPDNPKAHATETGPEMVAQSHGELDAVFIAVSTGGTLAGIATHLRAAAPRVRVIGVDAEGSAVFTGRSGPRLLTGIGSNQSSRFIEEWMHDGYVVVSDAEAFGCCRQLNAAGISVGGSGGAVVAACIRYLERNPEIVHPLCICADGRVPYRETIFNRDWLTGKGVTLVPGPELERCD